MIAPVDISQTVLETPRLILRPWRREDLQDFYEYARVDGVGQMAGWQPHASIHVSEEILESFISGKKTFALEEKETGKVIGSLGLENCQTDGILTPADKAGREVGYVLSRDFWGRGLMPEAVSAVADYCFQVLNWDWLGCAHFVWNNQSRRVIEKCGFSYVGQMKYTTRIGTVEETKFYIRYNPNGTEAAGMHRTNEG